ncbi:hypothetical protein MD484_g7299, partial [Candolleomyces efflorescens]
MAFSTTDSDPSLTPFAGTLDSYVHTDVKLNSLFDAFHVKQAEEMKMLMKQNEQKMKGKMANRIGHLNNDHECLKKEIGHLNNNHKHLKKEIGRLNNNHDRLNNEIGCFKANIKQQCEGENRALAQCQKMAVCLERIVLPLHRCILMDEAREKIYTLLTKFTWEGVVNAFSIDEAEK